MFGLPDSPIWRIYPQFSFMPFFRYRGDGLLLHNVKDTLAQAALRLFAFSLDSGKKYTRITWFFLQSGCGRHTPKPFLKRLATRLCRRAEVGMYGERTDLGAIKQTFAAASGGIMTEEQESLQTKIEQCYVAATRARDSVAVGTLRLMRAAIKDRIIAKRGESKEPLREEEILNLLQSMIKQRRESVDAFQKGGREDLAKNEAREIDIISQFLPRQLGEDEICHAIELAIGDTGACSLKGMGQVMAALRERHAAEMDFALAGKIARKRLESPIGEPPASSGA